MRDTDGVSHADEQPIPLSVAAREVPNRRGGLGINAATVWRWAQRGVRGVKLETILVGGTRMTTRQAMQRFHEAVTSAVDGPPVNIRSSSARQKAIEAAERELAKAGI